MGGAGSGSSPSEPTGDPRQDRVEEEGRSAAGAGDLGTIGTVTVPALGNLGRARATAHRAVQVAVVDHLLHPVHRVLQWLVRYYLDDARTARGPNLGGSPTPQGHARKRTRSIATAWHDEA